jgi:23S rRNA (cytosine1962-C5)-methyltransferase
LNYPKLRIRNKEELRLERGHLWAFSNELLDLPKDLPAGSIVTLVREKNGQPIGTGFYNSHSLIAVRLLSRNPSEAIDADFFARAIRQSASRRKLLSERRNAYRLVHGESDGLPGLIIDRFNDVIAVQVLSAGFEAHKETIFDLLQREFSPAAIVEKNNSHLRKLEGLPLGELLVFGTNAVTEIQDERGTRFAIDVLAGQKTGFYLDQMENRTRLRDFVTKGDCVLDLFANDGGFAMNAALAGAASVVAVDESAPALERLKRNADLNGVSHCFETISSDCFDYLRNARDQNSKAEFDLIVLDPPALAKSKKDILVARKSYVTLNRIAMSLLKPNGTLLTCSCSHHIDREHFLEIIREAAGREGRTARILEERGAGIDHPILSAMPETAYLKCFIVSIG